MISCQSCTRMKAARFPVLGRRARLGATGVELAAEEPLLLDPCLDHPQEHLIFMEDGMCVGTSKRGQVTVEVIGLNRIPLVQARREVWQETLTFLSLSTLERTNNLSWAERLRQQVGPDQSYTATRLQCVERWLGQHDNKIGSAEVIRALRSAISGDPAETRLAASEQVEKGALKAYEEGHKKQRRYSVEASDKDQVASYYLGAKRIERVEIRNFRLIEDLVLDFPAPRTDREPWMMLLGENGVGKSSVLQGVALALMGESHANRLRLDASRFVRRQAKDGEGYVRVHLTSVGPVEVRFRRGSPKFSVQPREPKVLVLGYGATRLLPHEARRTASRQKAVRILNLFDPTAPLSPTAAWLHDSNAVSDEWFDEFTKTLIPLLMLPRNSRFRRDYSEIEVEYRGVRRPLRDLSDGYQSLVALMGDIAIGVSDKWESLREAEGVVLLDEIEAHLHPTWKISIVERLREACPRLTFLVTTHDPLCLKGLDSEEIVVLKTDDDERVYAETDVPSLTHLRVDQLLTSFLFGLESTRSRATAPMVARYSMLLGKSQRNQAQEKEFKTLRAALKEQMTSAVTPAQLRVEEAVKRVLGHLPEQMEVDPLTLSAEIRRQVGDLLLEES
jgi:predicted ATPase